MNVGSVVTLNNCLIYENRARQEGGAIGGWSGTS